MEKTKEEIITELYALRGGLSLISQNVDVIKENHEKKREIIEKIQDNTFIESEIRRNEMLLAKHYSPLCGQYQRQVNKIEAKKQKLEQLIPQAEAEARRRAEPWKRVARNFLMLAILFPILCIATIMLEGMGKLPPGFNGAGMLLLVLIEPLWIILTVVFFKKSNNVSGGNYEIWKLMSEIEEDEEDLADRRDFLNSQDKENQEKKDECEKKLEELKLKLQERDKCEKQLSELYDIPEVEIANQNIEAIEASLHEIYDGWITESDWGNVDLLIFYLNTGRADTFKEALLLVDKQRQTDQIVNAINSASRAICNTIQRNMSAMAEGIVGCFKQMSVQMQKNAEANRRAIEGMGQKISDQMKVGFEQQLEVSKLNNALLEKSNETSRELLADLKYFRGEWEEERWEDEWEDD